MLLIAIWKKYNNIIRLYFLYFRAFKDKKYIILVIMNIKHELSIWLYYVH